MNRKENATTQFTLESELKIAFSDGSPLTIDWSDDGPEIKFSTKDGIFIPALAESLNIIDGLMIRDDAYPFKTKDTALFAIAQICSETETMGEFVKRLRYQMLTAYRDGKNMGFRANWNIFGPSLKINFANGSSAHIIAHLNDFECEILGGRDGSSERIRDVVARSVLGLSSTDFGKHLVKLGFFAEEKVSVEDWASGLEEVFPEATPQMAP